MNSKDAHLALVREMWPEIKARSIEPIGDGWTCDTYDVDGRWIVQFPRRQYAEDMLHKQIQVLPRLALRLSSPIPEPILPDASAATAMLYRKIDGVPFTDAPDGEWPEQLGKMLRELQSIAPGEIGLPGRGVEQLREDRDKQLRNMADHIFPLLEPSLREKFKRAFQQQVGNDEQWRFAPVLSHGDLGPEHILVDTRGRLAGVIDWEEIEVDDPASGLAWLMYEVPAIGARVVEAAGRAGDVGLAERARFLYALMPFHEVMYGQDTNQPSFVESGVKGIRARAGLL